MKIYNLGSLNIDYVYEVDHFVSAGETLSSHKMTVFPGGKGMNQSVALAKAGATVIHGAVLGDGGEFLCETMAAAGVDVTRVKRVSGSSGHAIIQVDKNGQNCIMLFAGTNHLVDEEYIEQFLVDAEAGDILLTQNETSGIGTAFEIAARKGMQIAFNPSPYDESIKDLPLSYVNWWFVNEIEGRELFGNSDPVKIAESFVRQYPDSSLVLTLGEDGSVFADANTYVTQQIYKVKPVDTTAAGDTFTGYFLASMMNGGTVAESLDIASKASAITVSRLGASTSIPVYDEVLTAFKG